MDKQEFTFDLLTQRFIVKRWSTPLGKEVRQRIIACIEKGDDLRGVLEPYVLQHHANLDPYNYPYYPVDVMESKEFWVLNKHDMRGIYFEDKNFSTSTSLAKMNISYGEFKKCNLANADFKKGDLSYTKFAECNLSNTVFESSNGRATSFADSNLSGASMLNVKLVDASFLGCNLQGVHFENTSLKNIEVNYLTKFDRNIHIKWYRRGTSMRQLPDLYRALRMAYEKANLLVTADFYLIQERSAYRKYILWEEMHQKKNLSSFVVWLKDFVGCKLSGYGTSPFRAFWYGFLLSLLYAMIYTLAGVPMAVYNRHEEFISAIYLSFTTFSTLGYGDLVYGQSRNVMRLICTSEAWVGAIFIAFFVVVFTRRILR